MMHVYKSAWLATADQDNYWQFIENAAIVVEHEKILWVGGADDIPDKYQTTQSTLLNGGILPGFIDCHTHLVYGGDRTNEFVKRQQGISYSDIQQQGGGIFASVQATRQLSQAELYKASKLRLDSWLAQGVTSIEIKSGYGLDVDTEVKMLKVAKQLADDIGIAIHKTFLGAHVRPKEFATNAKYIAFIIADVLPKLINENLIDSVDAFCENIAFSSQELRPLFDFCKQNNLPIRIHADQLSDAGAMELAAEFNALSVDHIEYANPASIDNIAKSGTVAVILPAAFYYLRETTKPPISLLREHKVPMAVASDSNPGTAPIQSFTTVLNMACILFGLTVEETFVGATANAAKALGLKNKGKLIPGFDADFTLWDLAHPAHLIANIAHWHAKQIFIKGRQYEYRS